MFTAIILSFSLSFVVICQTLSRVRCRSFECVRTVDDVKEIELPLGGALTKESAPPRILTKGERPTLSIPNVGQPVKHSREVGEELGLSLDL